MICPEETGRISISPVSYTHLDVYKRQSHDIKTPLTSIVNYVDLLSKEDLEGKAAEYTEVLVRQSARLKKLTEDLVEASKASTGNITVSLQRINICETVNQAVGEYAERLQAASLSAVTDFPDHPVIAEADGRLRCV